MLQRLMKMLRRLLCSSMSNRECRILLLFSIILFWALPALTSIFDAWWDISLERWLLLAIYPVALLIAGIYLGIKHGSCIFFPLLCGVVFLPAGAVWGIPAAWQYAVWYGLFSLCANEAAYLLWSTRRSSRTI